MLLCESPQSLKGCPPPAPLFGDDSDDEDDLDWLGWCELPQSSVKNPVPDVRRLPATTPDNLWQEEMMFVCRAAVDTDFN